MLPSSPEPDGDDDTSRHPAVRIRTEDAALAALLAPRSQRVTRALRLRVGLGAGVVLGVGALVVTVVVFLLSPHGSSESVTVTAHTGSHAVSTVRPTATGSASALYVHVAGSVRAPGLYRLSTGTRVIDAIAAAGGFGDDAEQAGVNLARVLADGEQLVVPKVGEVVAPGTLPGVTGGANSGGGAARTSAGVVNLNTATEAELETLPRVGPAMAQRILTWRQENGRFTSVDDLMDVSGIGDKTFEALKSLVTVNVDARLAVPAIACWLSAGALVAVPGAALWCAVVCWLLAGCAAAFSWCSARREPGADSRGARLRGVIDVLLVCSAAAALVASAIAITLPQRSPPTLVTGSGTSVIGALGRVDSAPHPSRSAGGFHAGATMQFRAELTSVTTSSRKVTARIPVLVFASMRPATAARTEIGATMEIHGTLRALAPGKAIAFTLFASRAPVVRAPPPPLLATTNSLRTRFAAATEQLPADGGALLPGLAIGDVSRVLATLDTSMKASSLSHLTAVSGANCAVVIAVVMVGAAVAGFSRRIRVALALSALGGFVILVTPGASVLRAAVMAMIVVFSAAAGRPGRGVPALSLAVVVLLVTDPWLSRDYGFALSVLATAGLLVLVPPIALRLARWTPSWLATAISIPLAAQLACQPVLILLSPTLPLYGVVANLLAEPAAPVATVLGLIACLILPVSPGLGFACAQLAWLPSAWIAGVARVCASLPGSALPWMGGVMGVALIGAVIVGVVILVSRASTGARRRMRRVVAACLIASLGAYTGGVFSEDIGRRIGMPAAWLLAACDIGQGDAVLVKAGAAHALVDVGPDPAPLAACLDRLGISRIDLLVLTHYDKDHVGGLAAALGKVRTALVGPPTDAQDQRIIDALVASGADVRFAASGDDGTLGAASWRVVWPTAGGRAMQTGNEGSVTVEFDVGGVRSIFLGDLDERAQNALAASGRIGSVDVVKVAHHGSADQSERLYSVLAARVGLISVGSRNDYGHPTARLLGILGRVDTRPFRTDLQGMLLIESGSNGRLGVWTERAATDTALRVPGPAAAVTGRG